MAAGIALSVPAALLTGDLKDKSKAEIETLRAKFRQQPIATGFWWAGGSSVLVGAKDNNPKQMALGAAMMAMGVNIRRVMVK
jgi:hypothetical protein